MDDTKDSLQEVQWLLYRDLYKMSYGFKFKEWNGVETCIFICLFLCFSTIISNRIVDNSFILAKFDVKRPPKFEIIVIAIDKTHVREILYIFIRMERLTECAQGQKIRAHYCKAHTWCCWPKWPPILQLMMKYLNTRLSATLKAKAPPQSSVINAA